MNSHSTASLARVVGLIAALATIAACGGSSSSGTGGAPSAAAVQVAVLTPGTDNDGSWGQAVTIGAKAAASSTGAKLSIADNLNDPPQYQQQGAAFASKGYKVVVIANGSDPDVAVKLANQFPSTFFCEAAVTIKAMPKNLCTFNPNFQNGDFLAGALAAMVSKSGHVGVIGGFDFPVLDSETEGFTLGARYINHDIKVSETFINTWTDVAMARAAAEAQIGAGADVIFSATDQATQGIYVAAKAHPGTYVVPQYFDSHTQAPDVVLTSVLLNLQGATQAIIEKGVHGQLTSTDYPFGLKEGVGLLAPYYNLAPSVVTPAYEKRVNAIRALIEGGQLTVPFIGKAGDGRTYDLTQLPPPPAA